MIFYSDRKFLEITARIVKSFHFYRKQNFDEYDFQHLPEAEFNEAEK